MAKWLICSHIWPAPGETARQAPILAACGGPQFEPSSCVVIPCNSKRRLVCYYGRSCSSRGSSAHFARPPGTISAVKLLAVLLNGTNPMALRTEWRPGSPRAASQAKGWDGITVGADVVGQRVGKVVRKVLQRALAGSLVLRQHSQERHHGEPPVLNLLKLQGL